MLDPGKKKLYELYHGKRQLSLAGIAAELGCTRQNVAKMMRKHKIKLRGKKVAARVGKKHGRFPGRVPKNGRRVVPGVEYVS